MTAPQAEPLARQMFGMGVRETAHRGTPLRRLSRDRNASIWVTGVTHHPWRDVLANERVEDLMPRSW